MDPFVFSHLPTLPRQGSNLKAGFKAINAFQNYLKNCDKVKWLEIERSNRIILLKDLQVLHARSILLADEVWAETLTNEIGNLFNSLKSWMPVYNAGENVSRKDESELEKLELTQRKNLELGTIYGHDNNPPQSPGLSNRHFHFNIPMRSSVPPDASPQPAAADSHNKNSSKDITTSNSTALAVTATDDDIIILDSLRALTTSTTISSFGASNNSIHNPSNQVSAGAKDTQDTYPSAYTNAPAKEMGLLGESHIGTSLQKSGLISRPSVQREKGNISNPSGFDCVKNLAEKSRDTSRRKNVPPLGPAANVISLNKNMPSGNQSSLKRKADNIEELPSIKKLVASKSRASAPRASITPVTPASTEVENESELSHKSTNRKSTRISGRNK